MRGLSLGCVYGAMAERDQGWERDGVSRASIHSQGFMGATTAMMESHKSHP